MSDATEQTPNLPATTKRTVPVRAWQQYLNELGSKATAEGLAEILEGEGLANLALFAQLSEDHGEVARRAVGLKLTRLRDEYKRGDWGAWLAEFAADSGVSDRTLRRWMQEVQEVEGIEPPKGAHVDARGAAAAPRKRPRVANISNEPIEATAVETTPKRTTDPDPTTPLAPPTRPAPSLVGTPPNDHEAILAALSLVCDAPEITLARAARANRTRVSAAEGALSKALAQTAAPNDRPGVNEIIQPRRSGSIRRPQPQPQETAVDGACEHPKAKVRLTGYVSICDVCGAVKRGGEWRAPA